jgi:hypothetical protein
MVSLMLGLALLIFPQRAQTQARTMGAQSNIRFAPGQPLNPQPQNLPLYNPYFSIYFGPLYPDQYDEPCYYNEDYGQWVGPCQTSLDTPGYSITIPSRVR